MIIGHNIKGCENLNNIRLYFQPYYSLESNKSIGGEILVRWSDEAPFDDKGAACVLKYFRDNNMMSNLDTEIIKRVMEYFSDSTSKIYKELMSFETLSINISPETLIDKLVVDEILAILDGSELKDKIIIEINEESLFNNPISYKNIDSIVSNGIKISLDDFNFMNYNIKNLEELDVKEIKISKAESKEFNNKQLIIIKHLKNLADELGARMVVEGVETKSQLSDLKSIGIDIIQGYVFSKPIPIDRFKQMSLS